MIQNTLYKFLRASQGNWHNSIFIKCEHCQYGNAQACNGFLLSVEASGTPIIVPVDMVAELEHMPIDEQDCIAVIQREAFERLFAQWLLWQCVVQTKCPFEQMIESTTQ